MTETVKTSLVSGSVLCDKAPLGWVAPLTTLPRPPAMAEHQSLYPCPCLLPGYPSHCHLALSAINLVSFPLFSG